MTAIALIPARSGSKRIKNKNIKLFHGKPIIEWIINTALKSELFSKVIVSTDSQEIADLCISLGAEIPFFRPKRLSGDNIVLTDVVKHAIDFLEKDKIGFDSLTLLYPTAPFTLPKNILHSLEAIQNCDFSASVSSYQHPIDRALKISQKTNLLQMRNKKNYFERSQDLQEFFYDAGQFITGKKNAWKTKIPFVNSRTSGIIIPRYLTQDIDSEEDWQEAEIKFSILIEKGFLTPHL